ncbi:MAG TPA: hypothetical protein P5175_12385 [Anaerohalosphaeraceae bacterium]|nr:hypothetical protein [Anaerohalosphaeraceae bacterium]
MKVRILLPQFMADDLNISENTKQPAKVTSDGTSVEQHSLADQIAADKYLASKAAGRRKGLGIKFSKLSPPGAE